MKTLRLSFFLALVAFAALSCTAEVDFLHDTFRSSAAELSGGQNLQILFGEQAGTATIDLNASKKWEAKFINDRASWCRLSAESGKRGTVTLTVNVAANDSYEERSASIAFTCGDARQTLVVVQKQNDAVLLSSNRLEIPEAGGEFAVEVRHNIDYSVTLDDAAQAWVRILATKTLTQHTVRLKVEPNESFSPRTGTLTVRSATGSETVTLYQAAATPTLVLTQKDYTLSDNGGTVTVEIRSNVNFGYEITEGADWIAAVKTKSMSTHTLRFEVGKNTAYDNRSGAILFFDKEYGLSEIVTIRQKQKDALLLNWNEFDVSDEGETILVEVRTNVDFEYEILSATDWIAPVSTRGLMTHVVEFTVNPNRTYDSRQGIIRFSDKSHTLREDIKVRQKQKDAMFIKQNEYTVSDEGEMITVEVESNIDFTYEVTEGSDWLKPIRTKSLSTHKVQFAAEKNPGAFQRIGSIVFRDTVTGAGQSVTVIQSESTVEKQILMAIYEASTDDAWKNWFRWEGWTMDNPLKLWHCVELNEEGRVVSVNLRDYKGTIPDSISCLTELKSFALTTGSSLSTFPAGLCNCTKLEDLTMDGAINKPCFEGMLPASFGNLKQLRFASFRFNGFTSFPNVLLKCTNLEELDLQNGKMEGSLPDGFSSLPNLSHFVLYDNYELDGLVPRSLMELPCWKHYPMDILCGTKLNAKASDFVAPSFDLTDIDGNRVVTSDLYKENTYTILLACHIDYNYFYLNQIKQVEAELPTNVGIVLCFGNGCSETEVRTYRDRYSISWPCVRITPDVTISGQTGYTDLYARESWSHGIAYIVDRQGRVLGVCGSSNADSEWDIDSFLNKAFGWEYGYYESTDYSRDGEITVLQRATEGNGINLVFLGEGYSDRLIENGTYLADMREGMEAFFLLEPYKSFRHLFNVYSVTVVSPNDQFDPSYGTKTAFGVNLAGANGLTCSKLYKIREYAVRAFGGDEDRLNHSTITTIIHSRIGRSVCYMGDPIHGSYSIAFCVKTNTYYDTNYLNYVVGHEAGGHGYAYLGDEYVDAGVSTERSLEALRHAIQDMHELWHYNNLDVTNDPAAIGWSKYLTNPDYAESVGIYEGGYYFPIGVYRPSENSIMRGIGGFNAPSREAIYYKIHKMAYGDSWNYDFADFLRYDRINLTNPAPGPYRQTVDTVDISKITAPPILNWR